MLLKRISKTIFKNKNGGYNLNFPKEAAVKFGCNYIFDLHDDKVVMYPLKNLGKIKEN